MSVSATPAERFAERRHGHDLRARARLREQSVAGRVASSSTTTTGTLSATTGAVGCRTVSRARTLTTTQTATVTAMRGGAAEGDVDVDVSCAPTVTIDGCRMPAVRRRAGRDHGRRHAAAPTAAPRQVQTPDAWTSATARRETRSNVTGRSAFTHAYQQARGYTITATATTSPATRALRRMAIVVSARSRRR